MISETAFCKLIKALQKHEKDNTPFVEAWIKRFGDYPPEFAAELITAVIDVLEEELGCGDWNSANIGWWLYDGDGIQGDLKKDVLWDADGNVIDVSTPAKFYNYLTGRNG